VPEYKKHHYVPRFYLKLFSENGRSINLFNIQSQRFVVDGNLKKQCYRDYFYGQDLRIEKALSYVEGEMSRILSTIQFDCRLPYRNSEDYLTFLFHLLMQHERTVYSVDAYEDRLGRLMKHLLIPKMGELNLPADYLGKIKVTKKNLAAYLVGTVIPCYPLLLDMDWKILRVTGECEFITSDNPVVYYNQFLSFRKQVSNTGLAIKGLQIFFPISPSFLVIVYDGGVYRVGSRTCDVIDVLNDDIKQLNRLQFVSALDNVYFYNKSYQATQGFRDASRYRRIQKSSLKVYPGEETLQHRKELLMLSEEDVRTDLDLSCIKLIKPAKNWLKEFKAMNPQPSAIIRNEPLLNDYEEFITLVESKRYKPTGFFAYYQKKYQKK
jgi:hypothetical protein